METKPNDYAYSSNASSPSLPPPSSARIATRIELIRGAKLNTRILIIRRRRRTHENFRHANSRRLSSTFYQPKNIFIPLLRRMNYPSIVNEYAQVKSPFRTIGGGVNGIFAMVEWWVDQQRRKFCVKRLSAGESWRQSLNRVESLEISRSIGEFARMKTIFFWWFERIWWEFLLGMVRVNV